MLYNFLKTSKKAFGVVFSVFVIFMLTSCENSFGHNSEGTENQNGKTYLSINVTKSGKERTITPTAIELSDLQNFSLKGTAEGESTPALNKSYNTYQDISENSELEIAPGKWTFILSAEYSGSSDNPLPSSIQYLSTVTTTIQNGKSNPIYFVLTPQVSGNGELEITFTKVNTSRKFDKIRATLTTITGSAVEIKEDFYIPETDNPNDGSITYSKSGLEPGTYHLLFEFLINKEQNNYQPAVNQWESYVYITPGVKTSATISLEKGFNKVYTIRYEDETGQEISDFSGFAIKKYSARSSFDLPKGKQTDKVFLGWKKYNSDGTYEYITKITNELNEDLILVADLVDPVLYLSAESGDDTKSGFNTSNPIKTITKACELIETYGSPELNWKIKIDGDLISNKAAIPATITSFEAKSLELSGISTMTGSNWVPVDKLNQNKTNGTALTINTTVPVTITNLMITGATGASAGGIMVAQGATLCLGDGVLITGNRTSGNNDSGGGVRNEGTVYMYGSAVIGDKTNGGKTDESLYGYGTDSSSAGDLGSKMANWASRGGAIGNGSNTDSSVHAKLYIGYKPDASGEPVKETLTGGFYYNGGGTLYNESGSYIYIDSGIFAWNGDENTGAVIHNRDNARVEMSGGLITNNRSTSSGGAVYNYTNGTFIMSGGQINNNIATSNGGGIANSGTLYLYGEAIIGDKTKTTTATATSHGNTAKNGGGITNNSGTIYIGYKPDGTIDENYTTNGGIYYNYANTSGTDASGGGGIYQSGSNGNGRIYMATGTIAYNASAKEGGAVYISSSKYFELSGGTISNNYAVNGGGAFSIGSVSNEFGISGNPSIPKGDGTNDIYLKGANIQIDGALDTNFTAYLSFKPYGRIRPVLILKEGADTTLANEYQKFEIKPFTFTDDNGDQHTSDYILTDGVDKMNSYNGSFIIEGDTWENDLSRYISEMPATGGTVRVGGTISWTFPSKLNAALQSQPDTFKLTLDLSKTNGWGDSMPSFANEEYTDLKAKLENIILPYTVSVITSTLGKQGPVFNGCSNLKSITLTPKITRIWNDTFTGCTSLTDVYYTGSQSQKESKQFQDETILNENVTWHYTGYGITIDIDVGTNSSIEVSVLANGAVVTDVSSISKGTLLTFTVDSSGYTTYKWKLDSVQKSSDSSLEIDTTNWIVGATYNVSLIAADASGNEDSYFAQITVTE